MSNKPFRLDQLLLKGFCPPSFDGDSDDESSYGMKHTRGLVSGISNSKEAKPFPTETAPRVGSTSKQTTDAETSDTSRRRIFRTPNTTKPPVTKKDIPPQAENPPPPVVETKVTPTPNTEKELPETETAPSLIAEMGDDTPKPSTKTEVFKTEMVSSLADSTEEPPPSSTEQEPQETEIADVSEASGENISEEKSKSDSAATSKVGESVARNESEIGDKEEAETDRSTSNTIFFPLMVVVCAFFLYFFADFERADIESISVDSMLNLVSQEATNIKSKLNSIITEDPVEPVPEAARSGGVMDTPMEESSSQDEIDAEHRNDESPLAEPEHDDTSSSTSSTESPIHLEDDEEAPRGAEGTLNSDLDDQEQVDTTVEGGAETEESASYPQEATSSDHNIASNADMVHKEQVDTSDESNNVLEVTDMADSGDGSEPDEQSEISLDHDAVIADSVSDQGHEEHTDTLVEHDPSVESSDSETEGEKTNSDHEDQMNAIEPEVDLEHEQQAETFVEPETEIENVDSDLACGEEAEMSVENEDGGFVNEDSEIHDTDTFESEESYGVEADNKDTDIPDENEENSVREELLESDSGDVEDLQNIDELESIVVASDYQEPTLSDGENQNGQVDVKREIESMSYHSEHSESIATVSDYQEPNQSEDGNDQVDVEREIESTIYHSEHTGGVEVELESIAAASDYQEPNQSEDGNDQVDVEQETESTIYHSEHTGGVEVELESIATASDYQEPNQSEDMNQNDQVDVEQETESTTYHSEHIARVEESIVTASDYQEPNQSEDVTQNSQVDVGRETGSTRYHSVHTERVEVEAQSTGPENKTMRFFKLRSDELGPYLVICEAYLDQNTINTSPEYICSE